MESKAHPIVVIIWTNTNTKRPTKADTLTCAYLPKWYISTQPLVQTNEENKIIVLIKQIPMNMTLTQSHQWNAIFPWIRQSRSQVNVWVFVCAQELGESKNRRLLPSMLMYALQIFQYTHTHTHTNTSFYLTNKWKQVKKKFLFFHREFRENGK